MSSLSHAGPPRALPVENRGLYIVPDSGEVSAAIHGSHRSSVTVPAGQTFQPALTVHRPIYD